MTLTLCGAQNYVHHREDPRYTLRNDAIVATKARGTIYTRSVEHRIDHRWERENLLRQWRAGRVSKRDICDAQSILLSAAKYHGQVVKRPCPICGEHTLVEVLWIYGEGLGKKSGTARTKDEVDRISREASATGVGIDIHRVEVCTACRWNHLITETHRPATLE